MKKLDKKALAINAIKRTCDGDNSERTNIFTVDDFIYYYMMYLVGTDY